MIRCIQIDTREKKQAIELVVEELEKQGIKYFKSKLYVGDYMSLDNPRLIIDRKQDLIELCGNVCQQHERFKEELLKANDVGIKLIFLVEHGEDINSIEDVYFWENPRRTDKHRRDYSPNATNGDKLYKSLCTIRDRYDADFEFCTKENTGKRIIEILGGEGNYQ